jgi:hypothetical protein
MVANWNTANKNRHSPGLTDRAEQLPGRDVHHRFTMPCAQGMCPWSLRTRGRMVCVGPILDGGGGPSPCFAPTSVSGPLAPAVFVLRAEKALPWPRNCGRNPTGATQQRRCFPSKKKSKEDAAPWARHLTLLTPETSPCLLLIAYYSVRFYSSPGKRVRKENTVF